MKTFIKYIAIPLSVVFLGIAACSDMNDLHDKYLRDGETVYIAIFDSFYVNPGYNAVEVKYRLSDPKAKHVVIYWNLKQDSVKRDINVTNGDNPGTILIENLEEGNISFEMYNYDADYEDRSIVMQRTVSVYGDFYKSHLDNRIIKNYLYSRADKKLTINWVSAVYENAVSTEIKYLTATGIEKDVVIPVTETQTVLTDVMELSIIEYRTLYKPEETCIDVFATDYITFEIENPLPVVSSAPASGITGRTITLTGTYIDSIDEVWFGSFKGIIEDRTETSLIVTIPANATAGTVNLIIKYGSETQILVENFVITGPSPSDPMIRYENVCLYGPANVDAGFFKLETGKNVSPCVFKENGADGHYLLLAGGSGGLQVAGTQLNNMTARFSCDGTALANRTHAKEVRFKKITDGVFYDAVKNKIPISLSVDGAVEAGLLLNSTGSPNPLSGLDYQQVARHYPEDDDRNDGLDGWPHEGVFFFTVWDTNSYTSPVAGIGFIELLDCSRTSDADNSGTVTVNIWYQSK